MKLKLLAPADWGVLVIALVIIAFSVRLTQTGAEEAGQVSIQTEQQEYRYPLDQENHLTMEGPLGTTHIEIQDGRIRVTASPGRHKICIAGGWISRQGQWLACLPNRIFIRIVSGQSSTVDGWVY